MLTYNIKDLETLNQAIESRVETINARRSSFGKMLQEDQLVLGHEYTTAEQYVGDLHTLIAYEAELRALFAVREVLSAVKAGEISAVVALNDLMTYGPLSPARDTWSGRENDARRVSVDAANAIYRDLTRLFLTEA
jgi:hypothetical protein